jgi:hypothetical protein
MRQALHAYPTLITTSLYRSNAMTNHSISNNEQLYKTKNSELIFAGCLLCEAIDNIKKKLSENEAGMVLLKTDYFEYLFRIRNKWENIFCSK